jgi:hypothetical protein
LLLTEKWRDKLFKLIALGFQSQYMKLFTLTKPLEDFCNAIKEHIEINNELQKLNIRTPQELAQLDAMVRDSENKSKRLLQSSFDDSDNDFYKDYKGARYQGFNTGLAPTVDGEVYRLKQMLIRKNNSLKETLGHIRIADYVTNPEQVKIEERRNYQTNEKLDFLLGKLYEVERSQYYDAGRILTYSGVPLGYDWEDRDLAMSLFEDGYIDLHSGTMCQIKTKGSLYIEGKKKAPKDEYDKIPNDAKKVNEKLDEILRELKVRGCESEILFEEMQELKELYTKLNKKTWGQVLKGKLFDLGLSQVVDTDTIKWIYHSITEHKLLLP